MKFAQQLADGPTVAHAATKKMVRAQLEEGMRGADARIGEYAAAAVRDRGPAERREVVPEGRPRQGDFRGTLNPEGCAERSSSSAACP